jgi:hypothetical protein
MQPLTRSAYVVMQSGMLIPQVAEIVEGGADTCFLTYPDLQV